MINRRSFLKVSLLGLCLSFLKTKILHNQSCNSCLPASLPMSINGIVTESHKAYLPNIVK